MDVIFKPFCAQISCVKFISAPSDPESLFLVGTNFENVNTLTLMSHSLAGKNQDEPLTLSRIRHQSDVMDIQYNVAHQRILTSGSDGSLNIYSVLDDSNALRMDLDIGWNGVCQAPISGCIFSNDRIVAVSERGEIIGLRLDEDAANVARGFEFSAKDGCPITAVEVVDVNTFATANQMGQLKCWDVRTSMGSPSFIGCAPHASDIQSNGLQCLAAHPGQPHVMAAGGGGDLLLWDLRSPSPSAPLRLDTGLATANGLIWRLRWQPGRPDRLLAGASSGGLLEVGAASPGCDWTAASDLEGISLAAVLGGSQVAVVALDVADRLAVAATDRETLCLVPL